jgi:hypothetical protein
LRRVCWPTLEECYVAHDEVEAMKSIKLVEYFIQQLASIEPCEQTIPSREESHFFDQGVEKGP